jgi:hypothetical protein
MSCPGAKDQFRDTDVGHVDDDGLREFHDGWGNPIEFVRWPVGFVDHPNLMLHNDLDGPLTNDVPEPPAGREDPGPTLAWSAPSGFQSGDWEAEPNPFDPARVIPRLVDLWVQTTSAGVSPPLGIPPMGNSYAVYPLIYSAGADGRYEINQGRMPDPANPSTLTGMTYHAHWQTWWQAGVGDLNPFLPDLNDQPDANGYQRRYVGQPRDAKGHFAAGAHVDGAPSRALDHYDNIHNHQVEVE